MEITLDMMLKHWGINMIVVGSVASFTFATVAMLKKKFAIKGNMNLIVSAAGSVVWTLLFLLMIPGVTVKAIIATAVIGFMIASGGWQTFKDLLQKGSENFGDKPFDAGPTKNEG